MDHFFELPVTYNNEELLFKCRLTTFSYIFKFYITINGQEFLFERDDNGVFRVLTEAENNREKVAPQLLEKVIQTLDQIQPT